MLLKCKCCGKEFSPHDMVALVDEGGLLASCPNHCAQYVVDLEHLCEEIDIEVVEEEERSQQ